MNAVRLPGAMTAIWTTLNEMVGVAERTYCASGKAEDKRRWDKLMQSRAAMVEAMSHLADSRRAEVVASRRVKHDEPLNANGKAL